MNTIPEIKAAIDKLNIAHPHDMRVSTILTALANKLSEIETNLPPPANREADWPTDEDFHRLWNEYERMGFVFNTIQAHCLAFAKFCVARFAAK